MPRDDSEKVIHFWIGRRQTRGVLQMFEGFLAMVCAQFFEPLRELPLCLRRKQRRLCGDGPARRIGEQAQDQRDLPLVISHHQFNLLFGARRFVRRLNELGIAHRYEEFSDNHTGVDYRMDESLPFLARALAG